MNHGPTHCLPVAIEAYRQGGHKLGGIGKGTSLPTAVAIEFVTGARATGRKYGFDRFWRNVRTHTLHDPVFYKEKEVGNYFLNGIKPEFTLYT